MPSNDDRITGRCPNDGCEHMFVSASVEQVGTHYLEHMPFGMDHELAGTAALRLMDFRRKVDAE